jgi:hypothetical protein
MEEGVAHARRRLRTEGLAPEIQKRLDESCPSPHLFPRNRRNDNTWTPRNSRRKGPYTGDEHYHRWLTEKMFVG